MSYEEELPIDCFWFMLTSLAACLTICKIISLHYFIFQEPRYPNHLVIVLIFQKPRLNLWNLEWCWGRFSQKIQSSITLIRSLFLNRLLISILINYVYEFLPEHVLYLFLRDLSIPSFKQIIFDLLQKNLIMTN